MEKITFNEFLKQGPVVEDLKNFIGLTKDNAVGLMTPERLAAVAGDFLLDGVRIAYHRKSDDFPICAEIGAWKALEAQGEVASGVLVMQGGKHLLVAPTEPDEELAWSTADVTGGGTATTDRVTAFNDWNGRANTAAQVKHTECSPANVAPGFCAAYARPNANGKGMTAGKWWLPSMGELMMIYANKKKIDAALAVIKGAAKLEGAWYWSSTERSAAYAWSFGLSYGYANGWSGKVQYRSRVRAVSAFIL